MAISSNFGSNSPYDATNVWDSVLHLNIRNSKSFGFLSTVIALTWPMAFMILRSLKRSVIPCRVNICAAHLSKAWFLWASHPNLITQNGTSSLIAHPQDKPRRNCHPFTIVGIIKQSPEDLSVRRNNANKGVCASVFKRRVCFDLALKHLIQK